MAVHRGRPAEDRAARDVGDGFVPGRDADRVVELDPHDPRSLRQDCAVLGGGCDQRGVRGGARRQKERDEREQSNGDGALHVWRGYPAGLPGGLGASLARPMPIYEYKCPNGHLFEVFHGMTEAGPTACEVCGEGPLQVVLHPVAVHYKGSGFYSTDYGRKSKQPSKDGGGSSESSSSDSSSSDSLFIIVRGWVGVGRRIQEGGRGVADVPALLRTT